MAKFTINKEFDVGGDPTDYARNERLMRDLAFKAHGRLQAANHHGMTPDDVFQEVCLIYVKCREGYKPESGFRFSTYFVTSFWRAFAKTMEALYKRKPVEGIAVYSSTDEDGEEEGALDNVAWDGYSPEEALMQKQAISLATSRLDGLSRRVLEAMVAPSADLMGALEVDKGRANVAIVNTKHGPRHAFQGRLRIDFVVRHLTRNYNLDDRQTSTLVKMVKQAFAEVARELEAA